jgi:transposase
MRGRTPKQTSLVALVSIEDLVPKDHPLRALKKLADAALSRLSKTFDEMYASGGRPSIPPERLLKAMLLMALYSVRSERLFAEQLGYNMLFKWFLDMDMVDPAFDPTTFGKNRDRLLEHEVATEFFRAVVAEARSKRLMSSEHFSVDGTLIEAWASMKSFRPKGEDDDNQDGNGWGDFRGESRSNDTHESRTDPEAKLARKGRGREAKLCFCFNAVMENRNGLVVAVQLEPASGTAERDAALEMVERELAGERRITLGADRGYDTKDFVAACRRMHVTPHVAQNTSRRSSAIDDRTTRPPGYRISSVVRRRLESVFGWMKSAAGMRKTRYRGVAKNGLWTTMTATAYNLMRMCRLVPATS